MGQVLAGGSRGKLQRDNTLSISSASPLLMGPLALYFDGPCEQRPGVFVTSVCRIYVYVYVYVTSVCRIPPIPWSGGVDNLSLRCLHTDPFFLSRAVIYFLSEVRPSSPFTPPPASAQNGAQSPPLQLRSGKTNTTGLCVLRAHIANLQRKMARGDRENILRTVTQRDKDSRYLNVLDSSLKFLLASREFHSPVRS